MNEKHVKALLAQARKLNRKVSGKGDLTYADLRLASLISESLRQEILYGTAIDTTENQE
ncbi:unnamed protein product [marine sediment metagenome]|uniref:Uncharacterized protein n=1 Tax=marine sediment metagenome TaxID=412755 RepID=X1SQJ9_9ZZZZ